MSPSTKKTTLVRRTVVELDLVGYSHVARDLEKQTNATVVFNLNDQVQGFVDDGLREVGLERRNVVNGTAGDNALLVFERASEAHRFSHAVHRATAKYNALRTDPSSHRHFRIGISTGEIGVRGKEISGTRIIDSVRLEAAGNKGHILIDEATYEELPAKFQQSYSGPESVADKQNNAYRVYRFVVVETGDGCEVAPLHSDAHKHKTLSAAHACPVDISRIIKYAPEELIGREAETKLLNDTWDKVVRAEDNRPHILTFVALGGEGKTSLIAKWSADLAHEGWPGCEAVFAWSFYRDGSDDKSANSSDLFLKEALTFFGDAAMADSAVGMLEKGRRLAQLVGERRALLILDGVEPLQYAPTSPTPGELKDQGVSAVLKALAATNHGLCVVTTRYAITDLRAYWQITAPMHEVLRLSTAAGVNLLRATGVRSGSQSDFENLVEGADGHALTLHIIGQFLTRAFNGDIRRRDRINLQKADAKIQGGHAFRAMEAYAKWLENESEESRREVAILQLLGLFDRPATADCVNALREAPSIPGLTEPLVGLTEDDWEFSLTSLREARLLTVNRDPVSGEILSLDAHPLLREYFAKRMREEQAEAWRVAHRRLYEHLCATPDKDEPTLEDLQPLYQAVTHGCQAGLQEETHDRVWFDRILRGAGTYGFYSTRRLGAYGSDLAAIAYFFEIPWIKVSPELPEEIQASLVSVTAFRLRALGRLTESIEPVRAGLEMRLKQNDWKHAALDASNLSESELTLGAVASSVRDAVQSVTYADRSGDPEMRIGARTTHADALHQAGNHVEAEVRFREAEQIWVKSYPKFSMMFSALGFRYCDLLLKEPERTAWQIVLLHKVSRSERAQAARICRAVSKRAAQTLIWGKQEALSLLSIALDLLTLSRVALFEVILDESGIQSSHSKIDAAVIALRRAAAQDHLPRGLLIRAWLRSLRGTHTGPESAQEDLDEAFEIAERGPMRLYMADIHLYRARLFHALKTYPWRSAQEDLAAARKLIEQCGYWRRKEELEDAEAAAKNW